MLGIAHSLYLLRDWTLGRWQIWGQEEYWLGIFGENVVSLLKKYTENQFFVAGLFYYLTPFLQSFTKSITHSLVSKINELRYCTIQVNESDGEVYAAMESFIASKLTEKNLRTAELKVIDQRRHPFDDRENRDQPPEVSLLPAQKKQTFFYKGHQFWVDVVKEDSGGFGGGGYSANAFMDMLGGFHQSKLLCITMKTQRISQLKKYIDEWLYIEHKKKHGRMPVFKAGTQQFGEHEWIHMGSKSRRSAETVFLKHGQKEKIMEDIHFFLRNEQWYEQMGLAYRRGYLLHGPPGTGKTSFVQSVASTLLMGLSILTITNAMDDRTIDRLLRTVPTNSILLIEDIDHCHGFQRKSDTSNSGQKTRIRSNAADPASSGGVTMPALLNGLDGVMGREGNMVFMTCNSVEDIEPALIRPGRVDLKIELSYADQSQIEVMYKRFLSMVPLAFCSPLSAPPSRSTTDSPVEETDHLLEKSSVSSLPLERANSVADHLPPTPPLCHRSSPDHDAKVFAQHISEAVTPAELQNFFISNLSGIREHGLSIDFILSQIPDFLDKVKRDREHARCDPTSRETDR
ncbi:P-loop containing nucleoside triphosphate hydrolase protein [Hesseltinella vesiculosa]|uniref:P-loop containing nucleoside triphosphate hydrolase protein n=1 Tax=Hesseltinella vesiculosa TaxID=101127 RepID=A0A1X2GG00_9FUNG|nr:P-loop containing nucleoside triphosphate hydrolase protein [Hesseltinella vesiculosa]